MEETKKLLKDYIDARTKGIGSFPQIVQAGINTIAGEIPFKLKLAITLSELVTFSSHLRKPIELYDGTLVPTNAIVFALSASGTSKDKSLNAIRKSLSKGYDQIEACRKDYARTKAEQRAILEGEKKEDWNKFYVSPKPLQAGLGTVEGLMHHFADISHNPIGAGSILSSEIGSELQGNSSMVDIIKTISVAYDLGNIPPKIVKSVENQTDSVKNLPVNALFFGSQEAILYNNDIKSKFKLVFNTQLARRSIFTFTPEVPPRVNVTSIDQLYELREAERKRVLMAQKAMNDLTDDLVETTTQEPLKMTPEASKLFDVYMEYNSIVSDEQPGKFPISKLSRKHKQWLALKLAGSYAILEGNSEVDEKSYAYAINTVEMLSEDLSAFERELVKEPYEQLSDMCRFSASNGEFFVSLHELRKMSYITGSGVSGPKVAELCTLANSYDENGSYTVVDGGMQYNELIKTDTVGVSFKIFETSKVGQELKDHMSINSFSGYEFYETNFEELSSLLEENAVYSSFAFKNGDRKKENLYGGTKFVILDVDKSMLTDVEAHTLLDGYNHYVVRTSDPNNEMKFRVIMELDSIVDIDERTWKAFLEEIAQELGLIVDILPQSQIFLSYAGRDILKCLNGKCLSTKNLLERAAKRVVDKPKPANQQPPAVKKQALLDPKETFFYAFEAEKGQRSVLMYRALAHAIDLGADADYVSNLAYEINNYWVSPMEESRLKRTLIDPALRRVV
jgi:hypothetical protein